MQLFEWLDVGTTNTELDFGIFKNCFWTLRHAVLFVPHWISRTL